MWLLDGDRSRNEIIIGDGAEALTAEARGMMARIMRTFKNELVAFEARPA